MKIVYMLHAYPPYHNAGAETMAHQILRWLTGRGHDVTAMVRDPIAGAVWDGVRCIRRGPPRWVARTLAGAVVLTHLDETNMAETAARASRRPLVHILHNDRQLAANGVTYAHLIVANTRWVADEIPAGYAKVPTIVLHPPTFAEDYTTEGPRRRSITLVNLTDSKGAPLFYRLAENQPDRDFLAVTGAYGIQIPAPQLPNLTAWRNSPDMSDVWARTRILAAPSHYESYGKAAAEALAAGIPVVAHPTPGLKESLGPAGIFVDRNDLDAWVAAFARLDNPRSYKSAALRARKRAEDLTALTTTQLVAFEAHLLTLAEQWAN